MAKNTHENNSQASRQKAETSQPRTICGVRFEVDADGFARSSAGRLGHISECEEIGRLFAELFEIADAIEALVETDVAKQDDKGAKVDARQGGSFDQGGGEG